MRIKKILLPGWGVPPAFYAALNVDTIPDYGFFGAGNKLNFFQPDEFLEELRPDSPYILIAHSMGGLLALRNTGLRNNAAKIILIGGFAKFARSADNPSGMPLEIIEKMQAQLLRSPQVLLKSFYRTMCAPEKLKIPVPDDINADLLIHGLEFLKICELREEFLSFPDIPVSVIHGEKDLVASVVLAEKLVTQIAGAALKIVQGKGHALPATAADIIMEDIQ